MTLPSAGFPGGADPGGDAPVKSVVAALPPMVFRFAHGGDLDAVLRIGHGDCAGCIRADEVGDNDVVGGSGPLIKMPSATLPETTLAFPMATPPMLLLATASTKMPFAPLGVQQGPPS